MQVNNKCESSFHSNMILNKEKWVIAVGKGKKGEVAVIDSSTLDFK